MDVHVCEFECENFRSAGKLLGARIAQRRWAYILPLYIVFQVSVAKDRPSDMS